MYLFYYVNRTCLLLWLFNNSIELLSLDEFVYLACAPSSVSIFVWMCYHVFDELILWCTPAIEYRSFWSNKLLYFECSCRMLVTFVSFVICITWYLSFVLNYRHAWSDRFTTQTRKFCSINYSLDKSISNWASYINLIVIAWMSMFHVKKCSRTIWSNSIS